LLKATKAAVAEAANTIRHMGVVLRSRKKRRIKDGKVEEFQVRLKIGFKIER